MMSLLEKASIITTPTAYDDGKLLSVKPVQTFGSELVTNGDFDTDTDWTKGAAWTINNGTANYNDSSTSPLYQNITLNANYYQLKFSISNSSGSGASIWIGNSSGSVSYTDNTYQYYTNGNYTLTINVPSNQSTLTFYGNVQGSSFSIDNVSVKETIDGDFSFQRGSSATRVNEQGLVQDVQVLSDNLVQNGNFEEIGSEEVSNGDFEQIGSELVVNGDFATDSDWTKQIGWSISGGTANSNGSANFSDLTQNNTDIVIGKNYKITYTVSNYVSGSFKFIMNNNTASGLERNANGTYTDYISALSQAYSFRTQGSGFNGSIDNVSVKEVGQDWEFEAGWGMGDGVAIATSGSGTAGKLRQTNTLNGKYAKVSLDVSNYGGSGVILVDFGSTNSSYISSNGTHILYGIYDQNNFEIYKTDSFSGSIDNVSVKEVGQNWTVVNEDANNYVEFNQDEGTVRLKFLNTSPITALTSNTQYLSGKKYKLTVDVKEVVSGSVKVDAAGVSELFNSVGVQERIIEPTGNSNISFYRSTADVDITLNSVSLIEITDDTDLPRINYTNFDYQDVLGDELVTNGDFDTDSDWTKGPGWNIANGSANANLSFDNLGQSGFTFISGKNYKVTYEVKNYVNGNIKFQFTGGATLNGTTRNSNGIYTQYVEATANHTNFRFRGTNFTGSIDNVSIKEFTEDVLVPYSGEGSLLLEPQSTNYVLKSDDILSTYQSQNGNVSDANNPINSFNNSIQIEYDASNSSLVYKRDFNPTIGTKYTISCFVQMNDNSEPLQTVDANSGDFSLINNNTTVNASDIKTERIGSANVYKVSATKIATDSNNRFGIIKYSTQSSKGFKVTGFQLEQNSFATSYIPTEGSTKTRLEDICNNAGSSDLINSTEGVLYAEISALANDGTNRIISISDGTTDNIVRFYYSSLSNSISASIRSSTISHFIGSYTFTDVKDFIKVALSYKDNSFKLYVDGVLITTYTSGLSPLGLSRLDFTNAGGSIFFGNVKCVAVFKEALSDTELACLTS